MRHKRVNLTLSTAANSDEALPEMAVMVAEADFLSMSRPFIREPFLATRMKEGKTKKASCISCNKCFAAAFNGLPLRCYADGLP